jgi:hypothetical protein
MNNELEKAGNELVASLEELQKVLREWRASQEKTNLALTDCIETLSNIINQL